ncbi:hypothetical protein [uncultured Oscillibacter sp.]|uniref:hypothetical protein n=1 Tax=uncultured Oscillibacter sp. TaxID=876091 RepID=UPI0025D0BB82|nr:hypothetical protein [uncultured Oscillibacter sp.]
MKPLGRSGFALRGLFRAAQHPRVFRPASPLRAVFHPFRAPFWAGVFFCGFRRLHNGVENLVENVKNPWAQEC